MMLRLQKCTTLKARREEPACLPNFELINGTCYRLISPGPFSTVVNQCWSSWQLENWNGGTLKEWINRSIDFISLNDSMKSEIRRVWLPIHRPTPLTPLMWPIWSWQGIIAICYRMFSYKLHLFKYVKQETVTGWKGQRNHELNIRR
jgi:hypothetical protein